MRVFTVRVRRFCRVVEEGVLRVEARDALDAEEKAAEMDDPPMGETNRSIQNVEYATTGSTEA